MSICRIDLYNIPPLEIWGKAMLRKGLAVAVILLFIGVAFAIPINANVVKDDFVEFDVEFCGLGKKHTVSLTQQEADEVELFFDDMQDRLFAVESDDEAMVIFNEAVVELYKYGLLGELSVKQAQRVVTFQYQRFKNNRFLQRIINAEKLDDNENSFCIIYGQITHARFYRITFLLRIGLFNNINPLKLFSSVSIGHARSSFEGPSYHYPSEGSIWTNGTNGNIQWDGLLKGDIDVVFYEFSFMYDYYYIGIKGFNGIQITINGTTVLLGFARQVKIRNYW